MSADAGALGIIDSAVSATPSTTDSAAVDAAVETSDVATPETSTEDVDSTPEHSAEGKETAEGTEGKGTISNPTPAQVHKALQAFKDSNPEANGALAKQINQTLQRHYAMLKEFNGVEAAREASAALKELAGEGGDWRTGLQSLRSTVEAAQQSDALLYEGSPELVANIVEDLRQNKHLDALGKLAPAFLEAVKEHAGEQYISEIQRPLFLSTLSETGISDSINEVYTKLNAGDTKGALATLKAIGGYVNNLQTAEGDRAKEKEITARERAALSSEKTTAQTAERSAFNTSVAKAAESVSNKLLGKDLAPYLKQAYFKGYSKENLGPLGNTLKANLHAALKADPDYQRGMKNLFDAKVPDRAAIEKLHRETVSRLSKELTANTIRQMYPGYKPTATAAAGRTDAAKAKAAAPKAPLTSPNNTPLGRAEYVSEKPKNLLHGKDWELLLIGGKGYVPTADGGKRLVSWRTP